MSFYFDLGKTASVGSTEKAAGFGKLIGTGVDMAASALKPIARFGAKTIGRGLTTPGTAGSTAAILGLGGAAANELAGAAAERTGFNIPHFFKDEKVPLWSPQNTALLTDPKRQGWRAFGHMATRPIQTIQHWMGHDPAPSKYDMLTNYNPRTKKLTVDPSDIPNIKQKDGKTIFPPNMISPVYQQEADDINKRIKDMAARGIAFKGAGGTSGSKPAFNQDQHQKLTLDDFPFKY